MSEIRLWKNKINVHFWSGKLTFKSWKISNEGGCDNFLPTLTTNGLCHTYNGKSPAEIWKKTEIMDVFHEVFPTKHTNERFDGAGTVEGKKKLLIQVTLLI